MKRLFLLFILAVLCVPVLMAIPSENSLKWYLQNTSYFPIVASASYGGVQEMEVRRSTGYVFENKDTILVVRMLNNATGVQSMLSPVSSYKDKIKYIVIFSEKNNIQIAPYVFQSYKNLQAVYAYVDTISYYGMAAFSGCENLTAIEGRNGVFPPCEEMSGAAFSGCAFTSIDLSNSDSITFSSSVFANCTSLQRFVFPPKVGAKSEMTTGVLSVRYDGVEGMFKNCRALQTVVFPGNMNVARTKEMFYNCESLTELNLPGGVGLLGYDILHGCTNLKKLTIPSSVNGYMNNLLNDCDALDTVIFAAPLLRPHTFDSCPNIHVLTLAEGVDSIADYAFSGLRNISAIHLPQSLRAITGGAFLGSTGINNLSVGDFNVSGFRIWDGILYKGIYHKLIYAPEAQTSSRFALDNRTDYIGPYAFLNNTRLDTVMLHYHLETICDSAFAGCTNIRKLYIPNMQTTVGEHAFDGVQEVVWSDKNYPNACANQDLVWSIDSMGLFTMEGQGDILYQSWKPYNGSIHNIIWPRGVTIPDNCMEDCYEIQCAILPIKEQDLPFSAFSHSEVHVYDDAVGSVYGGIPLLQPVDIELKGDMEIIPMYDSLLVRWKAPGPEPENTYSYMFSGEGLLYTPHMTAFSSEAFHNRAIEYIKTGKEIFMLMEWLSSGQYPCYEGEVPTEYKPNVYEMVFPVHEDGIHRYTMLTGCGGNEVRYTLDSISTANTMPQNMLLTKDESRLDDGIVNLTFQWDWLPWKSATAELQLIENNTVIRSAFVAPINDKPTQSAEHITHTEQVTAEQIGYGEHTLTWRARAVQDSNHSNVLSSWAKGEDIQFTFTNPEGIEDIHTEGNQPTKVLHDGHIYILRGEKIYTLQGQEVR